MSSEFKDIEHLFSDKLQNFEVTPPESVWNNIKQKKRKGILFYFNNNLKVAALLLLISTAIGGIVWFNSPDDQKIITSQNSKKVNGNVKAEQPITSPDNSNENLTNTEDLTKNNTASVKSSNASTSSTVTQVATKKSITKGKTSPNRNLNKEENVAPATLDAIEIATIRTIQLKYLIYPSLMQFVYSNKRIGKKPYASKPKEDPDPVLTSRYSMEILGGPSYATKRLSGDDYLLRKESEIATMSIQTGLKLNYHFNPKFNIQTGVIIENRNEKIKFTHTEIQQKLTQTPKQVTVYHPVLPPKTITIIDSTYTDEAIDVNFNLTNKYTTISLPLVFGYRFALGKAQYRFSAGTIVNVHSSNAASVLARSGNEIILTPYKENSKIKASVYSAIALQLPMSQTCNFITELSYYNNLSNRLKSESNLKQVNYGFNLSIGASFDLKK